MKKSLKSNIRLKAFIAAFALMLFANVAANAAYCTPTNSSYTLSYNMRINLVMFNNIVIQKWDGQRDANGNLVLPCNTNPANSTSPFWRGVDSKNPVMMAEKGKTYDMRCYGGASTLSAGTLSPENVSPSGSYSQDFSVYVDLDQSGTFEESERIGYTFSGSFDRTFQVTIPSNAKAGNTTMRIVCDYYGNAGGQITACSTYYGETRDFTINIAPGYDIGLTSITSPTNPLTVGVKPIKVMLKNYGANINPVTSCTINWSVDGVSQTAYNWTGSLAAGAQTEVTLGNYNFTSKGVKTSYTIAASSTKPNGKDDDVASNDAAPTKVFAIPLPTGTYTVGGTNPIFATLKEATDLINSVGISGSGNVIFNIRPGTYTGPFTMDNFVHGANNFIFQPDPANSGVVTITAASTSTNYVWYINNIANVTFKNLVFTVTNPSNYGGRIFMIRGNADNYDFENNTFTGYNIVDQTAYKFSLVDCQATQANNQKYYKNTFSYGTMSLVLINSARNSSGLSIDANTFSPFTNRAIDVEGIANGVISNNTLQATTTASYGGIMVVNGTTIINNTISGITGVNTTAAGISVLDNLVSAPAVITGNSISGCTGIIGISATGIKGGTISDNSIDLANSNLTSATSGISLINTTLGTDKVILARNKINMQNGNGIYVVNYPLDVLRNKVLVGSASSKVNLKTLSMTGSTGLVLMNELIGSGEAMEADNSSMTIAYNSTLSLGSADVLTMDKGNNKVFRNLFVNHGTGNAFYLTTANSAILDGNDYLTKTGTLGSLAGKAYTSLSQMLSADKNARNDDPMYKTDYNLKVTEYHDELVFKTPLTGIVWPVGYQALYEEKTFDDVTRNGSYYLGAYIIFPTMEILGYSDELVDCSGAPDRSITVSAATSTDQTPHYQWYKDGLPMQGKTTHILAFEPFDYSASATYTCKVYCPGFGTLETGPIPVYALTIPSIVEQPQEVINAVIGHNYSFSVKAHYRGLIPPYYKDAFQWYKYDAAKKDSVPLVNDSRYAGTTSSDFTIRNLKDPDLCKTGDFYFVKIVSECGTICSNPFVIAKTPEVVFRDHPENINPCPGSDVVFVANAIAPDGYSLTYKWQKDGTDLTNSTKYNGVNTNKLQVFGVAKADEGNYVCVATIPSVPATKNSNAGVLKLRDIPTATASGNANITTKRGNNVTMTVKLIKGSEPLTVTWYYNNEVIKTALWSQYDGDKLLTILLENVDETQSGEYRCLLENECDKTEVVFNLTVTKWDETQSVEVISENGYSLYNCAPNPSNGDTKIKFEMPKTDNVVIKLIDQSGRTVSELFNGIANKGLNVLDVNTSNLNISSGVYLYTITTNGFNASMPMVIVK